MKLKIFEIIGSNAVNYKQAEILYNELLKNFKEEEIILDFNNVNIVTSAFFNGSMGKLLGVYDLNIILSKISFEGLSTDYKTILNIVIDNALKFYDKK